MEAKELQKELHPNTKQLLAFFDRAELPFSLQEAARPFETLANHMAQQLDGPEATVCLRKLLEAQDCALRALR